MYPFDSPFGNRAAQFNATATMGGKCMFTVRTNSSARLRSVMSTTAMEMPITSSPSALAGW